VIDEADVAYAGVIGQAELLRDGRLTCVELVDLLLRRIERFDGRLNAFRVVLASAALAEAAAADAARQAGDQRPLLGVPIAIKDNVAVRGQPTLLGTGSPEPAATEDDELVQRFRAAGLIVLGITHLPELAMWAATESTWHGVSRNPWDERRTPGGSSGGSAAAVAAGLVAAAHATDGLGSIRIPASCCGLVGLKSTAGLVPIHPHWNGLSHAGFVTRSVRDTAALLEAVTDGPPSPPLQPPPSGLRIALSTKGTAPVRPVAEVRAALDRTASILRDLGHTVLDRDPPIPASLGGSNIVRYLTSLVDDVNGLAEPSAVEGRTKAMAAIGRRIPSQALPWAMRQAAEFGDTMAGFFDDVDLLLTPTMPVLPRLAGCLAHRGTVRSIQHMLPCASYTGAWNACGLPAMNLPVGTTRAGLPVGVQLIGPAHSEATLLAVAAAVEPLAGWLDRRVGEPCQAARIP
jgi:amidase